MRCDVIKNDVAEKYLWQILKIMSILQKFTRVGVAENSLDYSSSHFPSGCSDIISSKQKGSITQDNCRRVLLLLSLFLFLIYNNLHSISSVISLLTPNAGNCSLRRLSTMIIFWLEPGCLHWNLALPLNCVSLDKLLNLSV